MASKVKPVDIEDAVRSHLKLALKATCKSLGDDYGETYDIEKSQKDQFYRNVSIHETEQEFQCFRPLKHIKQKNETDSEYHVEKSPEIRRKAITKAAGVKGSVEAIVPIATTVAKIGTNIVGYVRGRGTDEWIKYSEPIPARSKLHRAKGYDIYICKAEVSLRVSSYEIVFYVKKGRSKKEVINVPARDVLSKLQGWDESRGTAMVDVQYTVEAEHSLLTNL